MPVSEMSTPAPVDKMHRFIQEVYINANRSELSDTKFSLGLLGVPLCNLPEVKEADILNLHWVAGLVSPEEIRRLLDAGKRIVWTLHDQWPFTSGFHYDFGTGGYSHDDFESRSTHLKEDPLMLNKHVTAWKSNLLNHPALAVISPSRWLAECSRKSLILGGNPTTVIPYTLDTNVFFPHDKSIARRNLNLPETGTLVLYSGASGQEKRKGMGHALSAMETAWRQCPQGCQLVRIGMHKEPAGETGFPVVDLGNIKNETTMAQVLSACDLVLHPSLEDNLPNGIMEALHCGTPVLAYETGGVSDMVRHEINGILVPRADTAALASAIIDFLKGRFAFAKFGSPEWITLPTSHTHHAKAYLDFYQELLAMPAASAPRRLAPSLPSNPLLQWCSDPILTIAADAHWTLSEKFQRVRDTSVRRKAKLEKQAAEISRLRELATRI